MPSPLTTESQEKFIERLARLSSPPARRKFLQKNRLLFHPALVERLYDEVIQRSSVDLGQAERLAHAARSMADQLEDPVSLAHGLRARGHIHYLKGNYRAALEDYRAALAHFRARHREIDVGRTLNGALQTLIYLGEYRRALQWARKAREIFKRHGDSLRLARLDSNLGNILYRQDRFSEALRLYQGAALRLRRLGQAQDVAAALSNMAVCYISLNDFARAEQLYQEARSFCEQNCMPLLTAEADYNIAYLYYLRGEYTRAIAMYQTARAHCDKVGDPYHRALCDLDQSEMYLELNLNEEGRELAERAIGAFKKLGMAYEAAKALTNLAIAASHENHFPLALKWFEEARRLFVHEQNPVWPALIDLYRALVFYQAERPNEARRLSESALKFFAGTFLSTKAALCELLLARLNLQEKKVVPALQMCRAALKRIRHTGTPALSYDAHFVLGQVLEAQGDRRSAMAAYQKAHSRLENLRSQIRAEELKIAFLKDKLSVYESLVWMRLKSRPRPRHLETSFQYIEQAKSRSLADLIAFRAQSLPAPRTTPQRQVEQVRRLREELNWYYHQIDLQGMTQPGAAGTVGHLRRRVGRVENRLLKTLSTLRLADREFSSLQNAGSIRLEDIRSQIPPGALIVEFYQARETILAVLLSRENLELIPVASSPRVKDLFRLLQFQLSKFRLGSEYVRTFWQPLQEATRTHLLELYTELLAPIRNRLQEQHLIIIPHGFLHYVPFHALFDGERYLIDDHSISYAPSASVYYLCCSKESKRREGSLILGIPDPMAPQILDEVHAVASILPHPQLFLGAEASEERLRSIGATSRFVHIATHGLFRQDNPMFSSIRLGNSLLSLFDLYYLNLPAELVTLSGCATGSNVVVGGDELLGLVRGVLYAGAESVLVTLWDVNDKSTAHFMKSFYEHLRTTFNKAEALRRAIQELRQHYPHPYYWAPFIMIGKVMSV